VLFKLPLQYVQVTVMVRRTIGGIETVVYPLLGSLIVLNLELGVRASSAFRFKWNRLPPASQPSSDSQRWFSSAHDFGFYLIVNWRNIAITLIEGSWPPDPGSMSVNAC
jgi:hypothetical protein